MMRGKEKGGILSTRCGYVYKYVDNITRLWLEVPSKRTLWITMALWKDYPYQNSESAKDLSV